ncbi:alpha/beta fold hydrolase [Vibrio marisflavi]|uniref:AB hydrolase superfamily protein YdjP n=1 Tax=Vibrio marisflavi CECT 7928 TaxID=634439 RepID=A0ABM8ZZ09_9VIBR|nr:alpha/beta hydrolase [Vibrio marisflavi]CAH0536235.1 AB hydrolase superfamily protein YdjP [Vibrio marisflavi CECT 7928]
MSEVQSKYFCTNDHVKLHYLQAGSGPVLILLPGGGFSAEVFRKQIEVLSQHFTVISLDKRGHGLSEKVEYGYRVSRFAKDLDDLLNHLQVETAHFIAHSLGAAMIYNYVDLFGTERINKLIVIDEPPVLLVNPDWSENEKTQLGAIYEANGLHQLTNQFLTANPTEIASNIVEAMTTKYATSEQKQFLIKCMDIPGFAASRLYLNNICQDFRDVIGKLKLETLFITGRASLHPWQSHEWMKEKVPGSQLVVFEEQEGGNHFMFVEQPDAFNTLVLSYLLDG